MRMKVAKKLRMHFVFFTRFSFGIKKEKKKIEIL